MVSVKLWEHQKQAIENLDSGKILCGDVGSGKTITSLAYFVDKELPKLDKPYRLYVISTARKRDTRDWEIESYPFMFDMLNVEMVVDSWNNVGKYTNIQNAFFIFDEQRVVGSGAWVKAFLSITKNNRWILLSATPGDTWMDYIPVFVANGFYRNRTEFIEEHVVYKPYRNYPVVDRYIGEEYLGKLRDSVLVDMPYERKIVKHRQRITVPHDAFLLKDSIKNRWNPFKEAPIRNMSELVSVMRRITNGDERRTEAVKELLTKHPKMVVFYNFNYERANLREFCNTNGIEYSEWNGMHHQPIPESDRWLYLVQYTSGAEGWNCITTDTILFYSMNYSYRIMHQSEGRIDRLNTPYTDLYYYVLMCGTALDAAITRTLLRKKTFNSDTFARNTFGNEEKADDQTASNH